MPANLGFPLAPAATFNFLGEYAWASLPAASAASGFYARVTDVGIGQGLWAYSDGTRWVPAGAQVLGRSAAAVSAPADITEDTLATITVPAGLMGVNSALRVSTRWTMTNNANSKSFRVRLGGASGTQYLSSGVSSVAAVNYVVDIANRASAASQVGGYFGVAGGSVAVGNGTVVTSAVDTSVATTVVITGQKAVAGDTLTLESYIVEVLP